MHRTESLGDAKEFGQEAMRLMERHGVVAHPENFAVWYDYATGRKPDLVKALDALISGSEKLSEARSKAIYEQFYCCEPAPLDVGDTCNRLTELIGKVSDQVGIGADDQNAHLERLSDISKGLGSVKANGSLSKLVVDLLSETKSMLAKNRSMADELGKTSAEVDDLRRNLEQAREEALTDALTGIANRKHFDFALRRETSAAIEEGKSLCLIMCDIDHFKKFNDTFGHRIGDQVLKVTSKVLKESVKGRDVAARYGGEEFAVILPATKLKDAVVVADQIRKTLASRALMNKRSGESYGTITLSLGVSEWRTGEPLEDLVKRADEALYHAKGNGRNRVSDETDLDATLSLSA